MTPKFLRKNYQLTIASITYIAWWLLKNIPRSGNALTSFTAWMLRDVSTVKTNSGSLSFHTPNWLTKYRAKTLLTKEPETIAWIDSFECGSVFFDVGANVGIYSIYAAIERNCQVFAIEPSAPNQELLVRNIISNQLSDQITVLPIGLSDSNSIKSMYMELSHYSWGGAHTSLGKNLNQKGVTMTNSVYAKIPSLTLDSMIGLFELPKPNHLKIDVDGLERLVLTGGLVTLESVESIMVEVDPFNSESVRAIPHLLEEVGFRLKKRFAENNLYVRGH